MAQTTTVTLHIPKEAFRELQGVVNQDLSDEERRQLEVSDSPHTLVEEYIYREYVMRRRNLAEELVGELDVDVTAEGDLISDSDGILG